MYSDNFSLILSVKNHSNLIFSQFHVLVDGPVPKNKNVEFAEDFKSFIYCTSDG